MAKRKLTRSKGPAERYFYSLQSVRRKLNDGRCKSVLFFVPFTGDIVKITRKNYDKIRKEVRVITIQNQ